MNAFDCIPLPLSYLRPLPSLLLADVMAFLLDFLPSITPCPNVPPYVGWNPTNPYSSSNTPCTVLTSWPFYGFSVIQKHFHQCLPFELQTTLLTQVKIVKLTHIFLIIPIQDLKWIALKRVHGILLPPKGRSFVSENLSEHIERARNLPP